MQTPTIQHPSPSPSPLALTLQEYFCRNCDNQVMSKGLPINWYIVKRSRGADYSLKTVSILCSYPCLLEDCAAEASKRLRSSVNP